MHNCRDLIDLLTEYMEDGLPPERARAFEEELRGCAACAEFLESLDRTRAAVHELRCADLPSECHRRLRAFLERELGRA